MQGRTPAWSLLQAEIRDRLDQYFIQKAYLEHPDGPFSDLDSVWVGYEELEAVLQGEVFGSIYNALDTTEDAIAASQAKLDALREAIEASAAAPSQLPHPGRAVTEEPTRRPKNGAEARSALLQQVVNLTGTADLSIGRQVLETLQRSYSAYAERCILLLLFLQLEIEGWMDLDTEADVVADIEADAALDT